MLIDSHCHLDDEQLQGDLEGVLERAREAGVAHLLTIGTGDGPPDLEAAVRVAERFGHVSATVGIHPQHAGKAAESDLARLPGLLGHPKVVALGEIGLDYYWDAAPRERQRELFEAQLDLARAHGLPVVIHTREAWEDTVEILERRWAPTGLPCVMHCFTGGPAEADRALSLGFHLSFSGVVTYPKAISVQEAARRVPLDRLLVETDAPYLAPVPFRGKRNEPAFVAHTARKVAELKGLEAEVVARAAAENFHQVFSRAILKGEA